MILKKIITLAFIALFFSCNSQNNDLENKQEFTNKLIHETSPYLLQHAHNPVNWNAWNNESLKEAKEKKKLLLISVGYSACHWCHVMEHESFEDTLVASVMNKDFINIKIDREERPDIDQVYISAVQLMTGHAGWPLNVIALPDGRPVWGGTYFPKGDWLNALTQIQKIYENEPEKLIEYADKLTNGIKAVNLIKPNPNAIQLKKETIKESVVNWKKKFDYNKGGLNRAPKFMMPNNQHFLMRYAHQTNDKELKKYVIKTLNQISYGGVYDHVGGGFSRYSTDDKWHVPHFEKMLYDNAQLVSLYSDAYLLTKDKWYKQVVYETLNFIEKELTTTEGAFYSSLDADSLNKEGELEEGAFYVWQKEELEEELGEDYKLFADYYNINSYGLWEHNNYVLIRKTSDKEFIEKNNLTEEVFFQKQHDWKKSLYELREKRTRPRLDDKTLTSWNALMLKGYTDAYRVFKEEKFLKAAIKNAEFILSKQMEADGKLWHNYKGGKSNINGYLEDYAAVSDAFISLYQVTANEIWLHKAKLMMDYTQTNFYDQVSKMFFFTSIQDAALVSRNIETADNVIPASNSIIAKNFYYLSHYFSDQEYLKKSQIMLHNMQPNFVSYPSAYSNWMDLMLNFTDDFYEVVITGKEAEKRLIELEGYYYPNKLVAVTTKESEEALFKNRFNPESTNIFICVNNACKFPVKTTKEALELLSEN